MLSAVRVLDDILRQMQTHQTKEERDVERTSFGTFAECRNQ